MWDYTDLCTSVHEKVVFTWGVCEVQKATYVVARHACHCQQLVKSQDGLHLFALLPYCWWYQQVVCSKGKVCAVVFESENGYVTCG